MTIPPLPNSRSTPPEFDRFANVVIEFADATERLLTEEMSYPFNIRSEASRDGAAHLEYPGTQSKQTLLTLAMKQVIAGVDQCDLLRSIAAALRADQVTLAPFPLARTSVVIAAKAWYVITADSRHERLRRYLNEELAALYDMPMPSDDDDLAKEAVAFRTDHTDDYLAVGAKAGLTPVYRKKPRPWDPPHLVDPNEEAPVAPPSETQLVKDFYREAGLQKDDLAGLPYSQLSAATHGRFRSAGLVGYLSAGPSVGGVSTAAMGVALPVTAQSTMYAALATRTYLCALARYTSVPEAMVLDRLAQPTADWLAMAHLQTR